MALIMVKKATYPELAAVEAHGQYEETLCNPGYISTLQFHAMICDKSKKCVKSLNPN